MKKRKILQKIRHEGSSRVLAVTKVLPEWKLVQTIIVNQTKTSVTIRYEKVA